MVRRGLEDVVFGIAPRNPVTMLAAVCRAGSIAATAPAALCRIDAARRLHSA
jgi:hypothetical protein